MGYPQILHLALKWLLLEQTDELLITVLHLTMYNMEHLYRSLNGHHFPKWPEYACAYINSTYLFQHSMKDNEEEERYKL